MEKLWDFWKEKEYGKRSREYLFLLTNVLIWGVIGAVCWGVIRLFTLKGIMWLLIFAGYAMVFPGFLGGVLYAMNAERELDEQ